MSVTVCPQSPKDCVRAGLVVVWGGADINLSSTLSTKHHQNTFCTKDHPTPSKAQFFVLFPSVPGVCPFGPWWMVN